MIADALDDRVGAAVAHGEALAGDPREVRLAAHRAVERDVAHQHVLVGREVGAAIRIHDHLAAAEPFAHRVVRFAFEREGDSPREPGPEALSRRAAKAEDERVDGELRARLGQVMRQKRAHRAVGGVDGHRRLHRRAAQERRTRQLDQAVVQAVLEAVLLAASAADLGAGLGSRERERGREHRAEIETHRLRMQPRRVHLEHLHAPHHLIDRAEAERRHQATRVLGHHHQIGRHVLGRAGELRAQHRVLRGDAHRAGVEVAFAHHQAAEGDQGRGREAELLGAQQRGDHHVAARLELPVRLKHHPAAQVVEHQRLMRLGDAQLPRQARVLHAGHR